ncbi:YhbD family protein [uncultured Clostridium sp.]|uniref:YhbD family protein n=1 Tax=uncultured Clostridium sp. TaxID=59620 RepID=UPI0028E3A685|nr:YhbD family protein [uncultured Clostridium sp.]
MSEELISKKELLDKLQISYGQLYRWKRKKLIPEEWFIKKSVSTGQETFFPKDEIIARINKILELKDDISLDDLANQFSYKVGNVTLKRSYLLKNNIVSASILERFESVIKNKNELYEESKLFALFVYERLINLGFFNLEEINEITTSLLKNYSKLSNENMIIIIRRKLGICYYYVISSEPEILIDESSIEIARFKIRDILEKIRELQLVI